MEERFTSRLRRFDDRLVVFVEFLGSLGITAEKRSHHVAQFYRVRSGEVYRYFEFSQEQYQDFIDAESRGRYFLSHIRNQFRYERLAKLQAA
jgi:hypothetical protein